MLTDFTDPTKFNRTISPYPNAGVPDDLQPPLSDEVDRLATPAVNLGAIDVTAPRDPGGTTPDLSGGGLQGDTPSDTGGGGGFDFGSLLQNGLGMTPAQIAALGTAYNSYNNSGKYMDMTTKYADQMDPFGKQRAYYQDRLKQLTENPNAYLASSPDYQAALKQGTMALDSSNSAHGFSGSGHGAMEISDYGQRTAAQYLNQDRQSLMAMAGVNIGPQAAAGLIQAGINGSIQQQNSALNALTKALFPQGISQTPGGISTAVDTLTKTLKAAGMSAADISKYVGKVFGSTPSNPAGGNGAPGDPGKTGGLPDTMPTDDGGIWDSGNYAPITDWDNIGDLGFFD